jgi:hypothetical protein
VAQARAPSQADFARWGGDTLACATAFQTCSIPPLRTILRPERRVTGQSRNTACARGRRICSAALDLPALNVAAQASGFSTGRFCALGWNLSSLCEVPKACGTATLSCGILDRRRHRLRLMSLWPRTTISAESGASLQHFRVAEKYPRTDKSLAQGNTSPPVRARIAETDP